MDDVDVQRVHPVLGGGGLQTAAPRAAGVGHDQVEAALLGRRPGDSGLERGRVGHVDDVRVDRQPLAAETVDRLREPVRVAGADRHDGPLEGQPPRDREPDAPARTGDEGPPARQLKVHDPEYRRRTGRVDGRAAARPVPNVRYAPG